MRSPSGWGDSLCLVSQRTWLVSLVPLAVGLLLLGFGGVTASLSCRRSGSTDVDCTVVRSLAGVTLARGELSGVTGATLRRSGGRTAVYRVELDAPSGTQPLTPPYSPGVPSNERIVRSMNAFVGDEDATSFAATEERPLALVVVALVFVGVGLLASPLGSPIVTWTFERATGSLRVNRRRLIGSTTATYRLDEIASASVWSGLVAVGLTSGERLVLTSERAHEAVERIRAFVGIPADREPAAGGAPVALRGFGDTFGSPSPRAARAEEAPPPPPAAGTESAAVYRSLRDRLIGVVLFRAAAYRAAAAEPAATRSALGIVLAVAALVGFTAGMTTQGMVVNGRSLDPGPLHGLARMAVELAAGVAGWVTSAAVGAFVARAPFRGRTDASEMLRVLGYATVFRALSVLPHGSAPSWLLCALATTIAVREAAELSTGRAALVAAIAWVVAFAVAGVVWLLSGVVITALATAL